MMIQKVKQEINSKNKRNIELNVSMKPQFSPSD